MKSTLLFTTLLLALPACASSYKDLAASQEVELARLRSQQQRLEADRAAALDEASALRAQLDLESGRFREASSRLSETEAALAHQEQEIDDLRNRFAETGIEIEGGSGYIVLALPGEITFSSGRATLTDNGKKILVSLEEALSSDYAENSLWIEGHTDNKPIKRSKWESNLHLSTARALSVASYLTGIGVDSTRMRVVGHGEYSPKSTNDSKAGRAKNRRVEILILN